MKALVVTLADEAFWPLAKISVPNKAAYASRHGYDFRYYPRRLSKHFPASMSKIQAILDSQSEGYEWVLWTDADSLIVNQSLSLEYWTSQGGELIATFNEDGLNAGELLVQNTDPCRDMFENLEVTLHRWATNPWWEQAAIQQYIKDGPVLMRDAGPSFNRMVVSGPTDNTLEKMVEKYEDARKSEDFILHFAGVSGERSHIRQELMEFYSKL